jgi:serine/threonine protein kinase
VREDHPRVDPVEAAGRPTEAAPAGAAEGEPAPLGGEARAAALRPGSRIADKYVIERLIGEGGLGVVVAARHVHLDQTVAIKYLRPSALTSKSVGERFLREARLAAKIRSEHVVHVYDVGTLPDGSPYMVMEYLAGADLGRQLGANGPLPVERAIDYVLQACEALAEAHVAGIVHRDIKPGNLFVATSPGGKSLLKILDFGISKLATRKTTSGNELTEAGDKFGTPVYMSPEQLLSARDVDARADLWAIGVVLYELLTGELPFDGDLPELCTAILNRAPVPLLDVRPNLPEALQGVIGRCLEKDVGRRFQNVAELAQELRPFAGTVSQARVEHIVQLIRGSGEVVRPSLPVPAPPAAPREELREEPILAAERQATTGSGLGSWGAGPSARRSSRPDKARVTALVVASVCAVVLALAAISGSGARARREGVAGVAPPAAAPENGASTTPPSAASRATPQAEPARAPPGANAPPGAASAGAAPAPALTLSAAARSPSRAPGPPKPRKAEPSDPNAVINPFE